MAVFQAYQGQRAKTHPTLLRAACALVLMCILVAGVWPFHSPRNDVRWLSQGNGLLFGRHGSIVSRGPFTADPQGRSDSCSIEIWLEPKRVLFSGTILAFYQPESQTTSFSMRQSLGDLTLERANKSDSGNRKRIKTYVNGVVGHLQSVLITISSSPSGTAIFANGAFVRKFERVKFTSQDLTGRLIVGTSPVTADVWSGQLKGLAIYDRALTAEEVSQHFANWSNRALPSLAKSDGEVALYLFSEGTGNVVQNQIDSATDLLIPERFFVLHGQFLERPWDEFRPDWNYVKDIAINIGGFIPLGIFVYAYLSFHRGAQHATVSSIAFGFAVSLIIEVTQAFLPTRNSGMTDLMTNTLGTAVGVMVCRSTVAQTILTGFVPRQRIGIRKMIESTSNVRNVSDTARWVAYFRALETQRPDALFRDPYAERLAGEHGFRIANTLADGNKHEWAWVARTYLFDQFLLA